MQRSVLVVSAIALAVLALSPPAAAQYQWRDASGRMTFSDQPPPAGTPAASVLRAPPRPAAPASSASTGSGMPAAKATPSGPTPGSAAQPAADAPDRELEFRKRRLERAEAERKQTDSRLRAERTARACEEARGSLRVLDSGMRVAQLDRNGEQEFLTEEARDRKRASLRQDIQEQCQGN